MNTVMTQSIRTTALQMKLSNVISAKQVESPMLEFNKMCFAFVSNNWIMVIASLFKITIFTLVLCYPKAV